MVRGLSMSVEALRTTRNAAEVCCGAEALQFLLKRSSLLRTQVLPTKRADSSKVANQQGPDATQHDTRKSASLRRGVPVRDAGAFGLSRSSSCASTGGG